MILDKLRKLEQAATPGPWAYDSRSGGENNESEWGRTGFWLGNRCFWGTAESWGGDWEAPIEADAALIAAARNALPALIECAEAVGDLGGQEVSFDGARWMLVDPDALERVEAALAALKEAGNG